MELAPDTRETLILLGKLSAEDQPRMIKMIFLFAGASDDVKQCAFIMIQALKRRISEGRGVVVEGIDEVISYLETSPDLREPSSRYG